MPSTEQSKSAGSQHPPCRLAGLVFPERKQGTQAYFLIRAERVERYVALSRAGNGVARPGEKCERTDKMGNEEDESRAAGETRWPQERGHSPLPGCPSP